MISFSLPAKIEIIKRLEIEIDDLLLTTNLEDETASATEVEPQQEERTYNTEGKEVTFHNG